MRNRLKLLVFGVIFIGILALAACGTTESSNSGAGADGSGEVRKIKVATFLRTDHLYTRDNVNMWIEKMEEELDNVEIELIGGPEAVPEDSLFSSAQSGIVDVAFFFGSDSRDIVPRSESLRLSPYSPSEERENGYSDWLAEEYEQAGLTYLGRWLGGFGYHFWTNKEVNSIEDFKGLKLRSNPFYLDIIQNLNATPVNTLPGEVYTALERNMVDGFAFPLLGPSEDGWTEVTKYIIDEPFAEQSAVILMNSDSFSQFTEEEQEKIMAITAEYEEEMLKHFADLNEKEMENIQADGVSVIKLSDEESKKFHELVNETIWKQLEDFLDEEEFEKAKGFLLEESQ
ncbi:TRAP transporter substrate-binding protein DctP [Siminovitchia sediminis]|uniref:TRAP transporter substrate-binding protein DctP n=1 Tax=Siminovitchia sediminis TaxID=1274353 RepID=A0ABW4KEI1_9BACI